MPLIGMDVSILLMRSVLSGYMLELDTLAQLSLRRMSLTFFALRAYRLTLARPNPLDLGRALGQPGS